MKRAAVILATVATIMLTASNPAGASERVTYGDVRAQFEAVENGGAVIITRKGFETTIPPASPFLHSIRPIQPFFKGLRYCGDAGRAIHVDPEVVVTPERALACVHADPDADLRSVGPGVRRKPPLGLRRRDHRAGGRAEDCEKRISLGADLDPSSPADSLAHDRAVLVLQTAVGFVTERL